MPFTLLTPMPCEPPNPMAWAEAADLVQRGTPLPWEVWRSIAYSQDQALAVPNRLERLAEAVQRSDSKPKLGMANDVWAVMLHIQVLDAWGVAQHLAPLLRLQSITADELSFALSLALAQRTHALRQAQAQEVIVGMLLSLGVRPSPDDWSYCWPSQNVLEPSRRTHNERLFDRLTDVASPPSRIQDEPILQRWMESQSDPVDAWGRQGETPERLRRRIDRLWAAQGGVDLTNHVKDRCSVLTYWVRLGAGLDEKRWRCVADRLRDLGARWNQPDPFHRWPQHIAAYQGYRVALQWLFEQGFDPGQCAAGPGRRSQGAVVHQICYGWADGHIEDAAAQALLRWWQDQGEDLHQVDQHGNTALHYMAEYGAEGPVRWLLDQGLRPDQRNEEGFTPWALIEQQHDREDPAFKATRALMEGIELRQGVGQMDDVPAVKRGRL